MDCPVGSKGVKMKKILILLILILFPTVMFASPFGLKMGMTIEEVAEQYEGEPSFVKR